MFQKNSGSEKIQDKTGGVSRNSVEIFLFNSARNFLGRTLLRFTNFWLSNNFLPKRVLSPISIDIFFVWQYRKTSSGNPSVLCFGKLLVTKGSLDKSGVLRFSVAFFLSHSCENFNTVILQCFKKLLILKKFKDMGGGNVTIFRQKLFVSQCRKNS